MADPFELQLEKVINEYESARSRSRHNDASDTLSDVQVRDLQTRCLAAIERASGRHSLYFERATAIENVSNHAWGHLAAQIGVAKSLLSDIRDDYLAAHEELIHGEVFGDFLEMAEHLAAAGYKDAAAVIAGSTLESHLRQLCVKNGLGPSASGLPKKADTINAELTKQGAYTKLDQKNVTAWLGLRNDAAHGNYAAYDASQVTLLVASVRDFITRHPA
ncbi:MAG: hypothetical protein ABIV11_04180 [Gemmatimonadaceae bacterium]